MLNCGPAAGVVRPQREELVAIGAQRSPASGQMLFDEVKRERVVAGRNRCVGREHGGGADLLERLIERRSALDQVANALEDDERRRGPR